MFKYGLSKQPDAEKWKQVKAAVIAAEPEIEHIEAKRLGRAWQLAKKIQAEQRASQPPFIEAEQVSQPAEIGSQPSAVFLPASQIGQP